MVSKYDGSVSGINNADSDGRTLMLSCLNGQLNSIQSLLALGTDNSVRYICMFCFLCNMYDVCLFNMLYIKFLLTQILEILMVNKLL